MFYDEGYDDGSMRTSSSFDDANGVEDTTYVTDRSRLLQQSKLRDNCALKTNKILPQNLLDHDDIKHLQKSSNCEAAMVTKGNNEVRRWLNSQGNSLGQSKGLRSESVASASTDSSRHSNNASKILRKMMELNASQEHGGNVTNGGNLPHDNKQMTRLLEYITDKLSGRETRLQQMSLNSTVSISGGVADYRNILNGYERRASNGNTSNSDFEIAVTPLPTTRFGPDQACAEAVPSFCGDVSSRVELPVECTRTIFTNSKRHETQIAAVAPVILTELAINEADRANSSLRSSLKSPVTNNEPIQDPSMPGQAFRARADIGVGTSVCLDQSVPGNSLQKDSSVHIRASAGKDSSVISLSSVRNREEVKRRKPVMVDAATEQMFRNVSIQCKLDTTITDVCIVDVTPMPRINCAKGKGIKSKEADMHDTGSETPVFDMHHRSASETTLSVGSPMSVPATKELARACSEVVNESALSTMMNYRPPTPLDIFGPRKPTSSSPSVDGTSDVALRKARIDERPRSQGRSRHAPIDPAVRAAVLAKPAPRPSSCSRARSLSKKPPFYAFPGQHTQSIHATAQTLIRLVENQYPGWKKLFNNYVNNTSDDANIAQAFYDYLAKRRMCIDIDPADAKLYEEILKKLRAELGYNKHAKTSRMRQIAILTKALQC